MAPIRTRFCWAFFIVCVQNVFRLATSVQMEPDRPLQPPVGWIAGSHAPDTISLTSRLVFQPSGYDTLAAKVMDISCPCSPNYGKWLTLAEIESITATPPSHVASTQNYLKGNGVDTCNSTLDGGGITFAATAGQLRTMYNTTIRQYNRVSNNTEMDTQVYIIDAPYYLPADVASSILLEAAVTIFPLDDYPSYGETDYTYGTQTWPLIEARTMQLRRGDWNMSCGGPCQGLWTPQSLRYKYNITSVSKQGNASLQMAVASFGSQYFREDDQQQFATSCDENVKATSMNFNDHCWCRTSWPACSEGNLDTEIAAALTQPTYDNLYVFDNYVEFYQWANSINQLQNPPDVISVSYGANETALSTAYKTAVNFELLKMAAQGITVLFASGDVGAYGIPGDPTNPVFGTTVFPASSPWVTSVGGTQLEQPSLDAVEVCSSYSGGGFSSTFDAPSYQDGQVRNYLSSYNGSTLTSSTRIGRGYPDVSAVYGNDVPYCLVNRDQWSKDGGTSASTPVVASMIALLNQVRANVGGPRLGFINPWLYWVQANFPEAFTDVTTGSSTAWLNTGYPASSGWDACSGLGTLRFDGLRDIIENWEVHGMPRCPVTRTTATPSPTTTHNYNILEKRSEASSSINHLKSKVLSTAN